MSEDDFGIAQVEAQAAGRPVIALGAGGAQDTVRDGETGILVRDQTAESLVEAIKRFEQTRFDLDAIVRHARTFARSRFEYDLTELVEETLESFRAGEPYRWN
jgi:glycosyltransferase involved in cell wall biosynthesis